MGLHRQTLTNRTKPGLNLKVLCSTAKRPNLELKTRPKQLLGPLLLDIALPADQGPML